MKTFPHFFVSVALFLGAIGVAMAQETAVSENTEKAVKEEIANTRRFEVGKFNDNWFIGIGGGVNQYLGEHDRQMKFAHRLAPAMDVYFGKWFTPCLGFRIAYSGGQVFGLTNQDWQNDPVNNFGIYSEAKNGATSVYWQEFHLWNLHVDFMLNLMNLIGGYKERAYSLSPYFGVGLARSYALKDIHNPVCNTRLSGNVGILNTFRLCDALDLNIDVRGTLFPEDFEGEYGVRPDGGETYEADGMLTATIGLAYKFKPRGWNQAKNKTFYETKTVTVVDEDALNEALARNAELQKALEDAKAQATTEVVESLLSPELYVRFALNKSELSGEACVTLTNLAKLLNAVDTKVVYKISGYADQQTGSSARNQVLSEERAQAVYDFLVKEQGVDPAKLTVEAHGGVDTMYYNDNRLSRAVILTLQK